VIMTAPKEKDMSAVAETVDKGATTSNKPAQQVTISEKPDSTQKIEPELPSKPVVQEEKIEENEDVTMANSNLDVLPQNLDGSTVSEQLPNLPRPVKPETKWTGPAHGLPSRPETLPAPQRVGEQRITDRKNDHGSWELRDSRYGELGRMDRPNEPTRNRFDERHSSAPYPRGYDRPSERGPYNERDRLDPNWGGEKGRPPAIDRHIGPPNRDLRPSNRDERSERPSRDRPYPESVESTRNGDPQGRHSRDHSMGPPRSSVPQHSDRAAPGHGPPEADRDQTQTDRRNDSSRHEGISTSQRGSRTSSPSRRDEHRSSRHDHHSRDDIPAMDGRKPIEDFPATHSSRYEDSRPPTGPRTDRFLDGPSNGHSERFRETLARGPPQSTQPQDPNHGRLNQPASGAVRQDPQYGRLNVEVPSGPRMSNGSHVLSTRGAERHVNSTQAPTSNQISPTSQSIMSYPSAPDRQAPTGPSWTRGSSRNSASITRPPATSSAPQTPIAETSDVHPDRLKAIQSPSLDNTVGSMRTSNQMAPSPTTSSHPGGPRGLNSGQPSNSMAPSRQGPPPTGPSSHHNTERGRGRDPDKRIIQNFTNVLQQSIGLNGQDRNSQGASIRGRGGRPNNLGNLPSPISSGPPTGSLMQRQDHPPLRQEAFPPARADLFANRSVSGPSTPHRADDDAGHGRAGWRDGPGREGPGRNLQQRDNLGRDGPERRSTRHRSSRSHSRDRHPPPSNLPPLPPQPAGRDAERLPRRVDEMQRDQREHRGKGGPGTGLPPPENLGREGRRGGRDGDGVPRDRDRRQDIDRREMDQWDGGRGGGIDERERDRRDSGRKRRLEDVLPSEFSGGGDGGKRSRRGI
jgi:THO complex subunit 2